MIRWINTSKGRIYFCIQSNLVSPTVAIVKKITNEYAGPKDKRVYIKWAVEPIYIVF